MKMVEPVKPNRKSCHVNAEISSLFIAIRPFVDFPGNNRKFISWGLVPCWQDGQKDRYLNMIYGFYQLIAWEIGSSSI